MATGDDSIQHEAARWSDVPDDLLAMVYRRIASPLGRVRFAAVCRPWRAVPSWVPVPAPPPLPVLLLSPYDRAKKKELYCPEDGEILRVPFPPTKIARKWIVGSHDGGWVAAASAGRILIMNLFSGAQVALSSHQARIDPSDRTTDPSRISKIVFSDVPTSSGCVLAAITDGCRVAVCRVARPDEWWTMEGCGLEKLRDIVFFHGELYGVDVEDDSTIRLLKFEIGVDEDGRTVVTGSRTLAVEWTSVLLEQEDDDVAADPCCYLLEMRGKLVMAVKRAWDLLFRVFELAEVDGAAAPYDYRWVEMTSLDDHALFLSPAGSRAAEVPPGGRGGVQRNRIYYSNHRYGHLPHHKAYLAETDDGRAVYYDEHEGLHDWDKRPPCRAYYAGRGPFGRTVLRPALWLVPPHV